MTLRVWILAVVLLIGCTGQPGRQVASQVRAEAAAGHLEQAMQMADAYLARQPQATEVRRARVLVLLQAADLDAAETARQHLPAGDRLLEEALNHPNLDVRANAAQLLADHATAAQYRVFVRGVENRDAAVRLYCARALGRLRQPAAVRPLFRLLRDGYWLVRAEAVDALAELGDPRAAGWLVRLLADSDGYVRARTGAALRRLACPANRSTLHAGLGWANTDAIRLEIAAALIKLDDPVGFGFLTDAARSSDPALRRRVAQVAGETSCLAATNLLARLCADEDQTVRDQAEKTRAILQRQQAPPPLQGGSAARETGAGQASARP